MEVTFLPKPHFRHNFCDLSFIPHILSNVGKTDRANVGVCRPLTHATWWPTAVRSFRKFATRQQIRCGRFCERRPRNDQQERGCTPDTAPKVGGVGKSRSAGFLTRLLAQNGLIIRFVI